MPVPRPRAVGKLVTETVVEAPGARVALEEPDEAKNTDAIWAMPRLVRVAVWDWPVMFSTAKTFVNDWTEGAVPKSRASVSTLPLATGVEVPGLTALPGVTRK